MSHKTLKTIFLFTILNGLTSCVFIHAQTSDIEITFTYRNYDAAGKEKSFPLLGQQVFISEDKMLFVPQSIMPLGSLLMDASLEERYEINHEEQAIYIIKNEKINNAKLIPIHHPDSSVTIHGVPCVLKEIKRFNEYTQDTTVLRYWLAPSIPIRNIKRYAAMQGYNNTLILDGSLNYLPLRVEQLSKTGGSLIMEAKAITWGKIKPDVFVLPEYKVKYRDF